MRENVLFFALSAAALIWGASAQAADWWSTPNGVENWKVASDADSLECQAAKCSIWERTIYTQPRMDRVTTQTDLADYDCVSVKTRTRQERSYDGSGHLLKQRSAENAGWQPIEPNTVGEALLTFACTFSNRKDAAVASGRMNADGRDFVREAKPAKIPLAPHGEPSGPRPVSGMVVQVAASTSETDAQAALTSMRDDKLLSGGFTPAIEAAKSGAQTIFRIVVAGFSDTGSATTFCNQLKARGEACFVRRATPRPPNR